MPWTAFAIHWMQAWHPSQPLLLIGAGGDLKQMLVDSGVGAAMGQLAMQLPWSPLVLAQVIA